MSTPRPTPETDAESINGAHHPQFGLSDFTRKLERKLERERDEAREDTPWHSNGETKDEWFARQREKYAVIERERDEARDQLKAMRDEFQKVCQQRDAWAMRCDKLGVTAMQEAIREAIDSLHKCSRVIGAPKTYEWADEDVCDAAYNSAQAALTKLQPFLP